LKSRAEQKESSLLFHIRYNYNILYVQIRNGENMGEASVNEQERVIDVRNIDRSVRHTVATQLI